MEENVTTAPEFTVGSVISRTYTVLSHNFLLFFVLALANQIPMVISRFFINPFIDKRVTMETVTLALFFLLGQWILMLIFQGAVAYATYQALLDKKATIRESLSFCIPKIGSISLASLLIFFSVAFRSLLVLFPLMVFTLVFRPAFLLIFIIIAMRMCALSVTIPACVTENLEAKASLRRSEELTKNHGWKIFFSYLLTFIVCFIFVVIIKLLLNAGNLNSDFSGQLATSFILELLWNVVTAVIYYRLREVKEGVGVDALVNVFD